MQRLVAALDRDIYAERGLEVLVELESLIKSTGIRVDGVYSNNEVDEILKASLSETVKLTKLRIESLVKKGKGSVSDILDYISETITSLF